MEGRGVSERPYLLDAVSMGLVGIPSVFLCGYFFNRISLDKA